jgi:hypothetical protein
LETSYRSGGIFQLARRVGTAAFCFSSDAGRRKADASSPIDGMN